MYRNPLALLDLVLRGSKIPAFADTKGAAKRYEVPWNEITEAWSSRACHGISDVRRNSLAQRILNFLNSLALGLTFRDAEFPAYADTKGAAKRNDEKRLACARIIPIFRVDLSPQPLRFNFRVGAAFLTEREFSLTRFRSNLSFDFPRVREATSWVSACAGMTKMVIETTLLWVVQNMLPVISLKSLRLLQFG
jgi:hypothetical protein